MTIGNPASCLALYLSVEHFRGKLQHAGHAGGQKIKCRPIRTREGGVRLQKELYGNYFVNFDTFDDHFKKMKFSIKDFSTFSEEILNGKLLFLCSGCYKKGYNFNSNLYIFYKCPKAGTA